LAVNIFVTERTDVRSKSIAQTNFNKTANIVVDCFPKYGFIEIFFKSNECNSFIAPITFACIIVIGWFKILISIRSNFYSFASIVGRFETAIIISSFVLNIIAVDIGSNFITNNYVFLKCLKQSPEIPQPIFDALGFLLRWRIPSPPIFFVQV